MGRHRAAVFAFVLATAALAPQACSTSNALVAAGGACFLATDCEPGLVCVPQPNGNGARICSDDLSGVVGAGPREAGADVGEAGDAPSDAPPLDTGGQDTGGQDTGGQDTGGQDSGAADTGSG